MTRLCLVAALGPRMDILRDKPQDKNTPIWNIGRDVMLIGLFERCSVFVSI
jgi:hypothetical protein